MTETTRPKSAETRFAGVARDPEALDQVVGVTPMRGWIALGTVVVALVAVLVWSLTARVPQQFSVPAVILDPGSGEIIAGATGSVETLAIEPGQKVAAGDEVATVRTLEGALVTLKATLPGVVRDVLVDPGQGVEPLDTIATTASTTSQTTDVQVVTYVSPERAAAYFFPGGTVLLDVPDVGAGLQQSLRARIVSVAAVPSTLEGVVAEVGDPGLAQQFFDAADGTPYRVEATIDREATGAPAELLTSGQVASVTVTYDNPHPMNLLFGGRS